MFDTAFTDRQDYLLRLLRLAKISRHLIVATCLILFGCIIAAEDIYKPAIGSGVEPTDEITTGYIGNGLYAFILLYAVQGILKWYMRRRLWQAYASYNLSNDPYDTRVGFMPVSPVMTSSSAQFFKNMTLKNTQGGRDVFFSDTTYTYSLFLSFTFDIRYLVLAVPIGVRTPHIFIDGKAQNRFGTKSSDLWSLTKKLDRHDRLQDLEGDFYKYFDVSVQIKNI